MTFSIAARCPETGMFGAAVSSSSPCVAARCAFVRAGVGAVLTQNITDPRLGPAGLDLMQAGAGAADALAQTVASAPHIEYRQLGFLDAAGNTAGHSGANTLGTHAIAKRPGMIAAGNLLSDIAVPEAMVSAFAESEGDALGDRLIAAMTAAIAAGGEEGPVHSAGMVMADTEAWPVADLRIDWSDGDPIAELGDLWILWRPQMDDYVTRCLDPSTAPSYGVPGDA